MAPSLIQSLRPLLHPMVVHFPIALLFASVALDWVGYWLRHPHLTRAAFYVLVFGTAGAGVAALTGPDHVTGGADVATLLTNHQSFALLTVSLAVALMMVRFLAADGIRDPWALVYLACTVPLLLAVTLTGYYGGELTYHHAIGVVTAQGSAATVGPVVGSRVPTKPLVALLGLLVVVGLGLWLSLGRALAPAYFAAWWRGLKADRSNAPGGLWTLSARPSSGASSGEARGLTREAGSRPHIGEQVTPTAAGGPPVTQRI